MLCLMVDEGVGSWLTSMIFILSNTEAIFAANTPDINVYNGYSPIGIVAQLFSLYCFSLSSLLFLGRRSGRGMWCWRSDNEILISNSFLLKLFLEACWIFYFYPIYFVNVNNSLAKEGRNPSKTNSSEAG